MSLFARLKRWIKRLFGGIEKEAMDGFETLQKDIMDHLEQLKASLLRNPEPIFKILRHAKPILLVKNLALVTRFQDVTEALSRDWVFRVTYGEKMEVITGGENFFLGMENTPSYTRDLSNMRIAVRREDMPERVKPFVEQTAEAIVAAAAGRIDVVAELTRIVPTRLVGDYFGVSAADERDLADWATAMFQFLFIDLDNDPEIGIRARDAAEKTRALLDRALAERKDRPLGNDDILERCLAMQKAGLPGMDDTGIRNNLIGLITGAIPTTSRAAAQALDQLLDRPQELAGARSAAQGGDDELLAKYVFEALRFNPINPGIFRMTAEDYTLAEGTSHATKIPKGTLLLAATQSAMFDSQVVEDPESFRIDRPDYIYLHNGYALHTCFGQYINRVQIPGLLKPLLARKALRRAPGEAGELRYEGPFPANMMVEFEP